jgi:hypothetical protein
MNDRPEPNQPKATPLVSEQIIFRKLRLLGKLPTYQVTHLPNSQLDQEYWHRNDNKNSRNCRHNGQILAIAGMKHRA